MRTTWSSWAVKGSLLAGAAMVATFAATPAKADTRVRVAVGAQRGNVWARGAYPSTSYGVAATPVYEDVVRKVWREPVYETRRVPVHVPAQTITRKVPRYSECGRYVVGWEYVEEVIEPARTEWRVEQVLVREGYWETITERVVVRPAHMRIVSRPAVVRHGHWGSHGNVVIRKDRPNVHRGHGHASAGIGFNLRFDD
jgi:hypothetical protein